MAVRAPGAQYQRMSLTMTHKSGCEPAEAFQAAEEIRDPLDGLVERTASDPGAPYAPEVLERLAALKRDDQGTFEVWRARLKKAGCRVTVLDGAIRRYGGNDSNREPTVADHLVDLALAEAKIFRTPNRIAFADIIVDGHRETWPIRSEGFRRWLTGRFYEENKSAPSSESLNSALNAIDAHSTLRDTPERTVHLRVGGHEGAIYIDLCDASWSAIEVDTNGWRIIDVPPVRFRRSDAMAPLPRPEHGGSVEMLREFINVASDADFVLTVAWLLGSLKPNGPYPIVGISGEQGSAKSSFARILRALADPSAMPLRNLPRNDRDLAITANNSHVIAFDNVSGLRPWLSDMLCQIATGGGFSTRKLYTDADEALFNFVRPIILNGIEDIVSRADLTDRAVLLTLKPIPKAQRKREADLNTAFEAKRPLILGGLLDAVATGLRRLPQVRLAESPRMADFAHWVTACEPALWPEGTFMRAYQDNRAVAVDCVIDADLVASAVRLLMESMSEWAGTATDLLSTLSLQAGEQITRSRYWPDNPRALSVRLRRYATALRETGIEVVLDQREGHDRDRLIHLRRSTITKGNGEADPAATSTSCSGNSRDEDISNSRPPYENDDFSKWRSRI